MNKFNAGDVILELEPLVYIVVEDAKEKVCDYCLNRM